MSKRSNGSWSGLYALLPVTFGLGLASRADEITITWPGGVVQKVNEWRLDSVNMVRQP